MTTYTVTTKFYQDHASRCDICAENPLEVVKVGKLLTTLKLDFDMYQDLKSDAEYYSDLRYAAEFNEMPELIKSAVSTLKRLEKGSK